METVFLKRLAHFGIAPTLLEALDAQLGAEFAFAKGDHLFREGEQAHDLFFVQDGWLCTQDFLSDGQAFYRSLFTAGDVAGCIELAWQPASVDLMALSAGRARRLSRSALDDLLHRYPAFAGPLLTMCVAQQTAVADRHAHALRSDGRGRLLYLLLDIHARQSLGGAPSDRIDLPLTQIQLANAIGMTNVHVNALLKGLEKEGVIERGRRTLRFPNLARARAETSFRDRWSDIDVGWTRAFRAFGVQEVAPEPTPSQSATGTQ
ncbi:MAG: Crp/Fnr family transcriptional regulator [Pseudomonadota bacterium]